MKFSPLDRVFICTPAALLVGVVTESREIERHDGNERSYLVRHLDNVAAIAEMVCTEGQLIDRHECDYLTHPAGKWLASVGKPSEQFCKDFVEHLTIGTVSPSEKSALPSAFATVGNG